MDGVVEEQLGIIFAHVFWIAFFFFSFLISGKTGTEIRRENRIVDQWEVLSEQSISVASD